MKALIVKADGTAPYIKDIGEEEVGDALRAEVGGWIESVPTQIEGISVYCNEEGKIMGLPVNQNISVLRSLKIAVMPHDIIVGNIVVTGFDSATGDDIDAPADVIEAALAAAAVGP